MNKIKDSVIEYGENPKRTHYHFRLKRDMKNAMFHNFNIWDTFSWGKTHITLEVLNQTITGVVYNEKTNL